MARVQPPLDGVRRIAVLRPNAVGDFVFALPALHALKQTYPQAELVLIGKDWHRAFLEGRPGPVDRVVEVPAVPGVGMPVDASAHAFADTSADTSAEREASARFIERMRGERVDLALQMFGGGLYSNPFLLQCGARLTVGWRAPDAAPLDRWLPYREPVNRRLALLEIAGLAGAWPGPLPLPELAVTDQDRARAAQVLPPRAGERLVILQPGSTDPRRCWPADRFAALGDLLAGEGAHIVINGSPAEAALVRSVAEGMRHRATVLAGGQALPGPASRHALDPGALDQPAPGQPPLDQPSLDPPPLDLGGLCGLLERAALVVSNDTGPLHLALALGVPSVGIFWLTNLLEGMPLRPSALHVALAVRTRCPVCGQDNLRMRCAHDLSFVDEVGVDEVASLARAALAHQ